jgi:hypothetical protein
MCGRCDNLIARDAYRGLFKAGRLPNSNFPPEVQCSAYRSDSHCRIDPLTAPASPCSKRKKPQAGLCNAGEASVSDGVRRALDPAGRERRTNQTERRPGAMPREGGKRGRRPNQEGGPSCLATATAPNWDVPNRKPRHVEAQGRPGLHGRQGHGATRT